MNLQRREEIRAIAECPNDRHWAQEMRRAVAELLAHIDTLEQTAAERVIRGGSSGPTPDYTGEGSAWVPPVEAQAVAVPEPGDRAGWVRVDRGDIDTLSKAIDKIVLDSWARSDAEDASVTALCLAFQPIHLAIRANQGGAATC